MYEGVTEKLVDFALQARYEDLPAQAVKAAKLVFLDSIGCALAGQVVDRGRLAVRYVEGCGGHPQAGIIGYRRFPYALAAFANGELINALDYDVVGPMGGGHVCPFVLPSCLAMAERTRACGKELVAALAAGFEVGGRVAGSLAGLKIVTDRPPYYEDSPRFTQAYSVFGGVAAAGRLIGLERASMASAFGIAGASCPVPAGAKWEHISAPAIMVKYNAWTGWVAQLTVTAALLAEQGFTGDSTILDGEGGFWQIVGSPYFKEKTLLDGLGRVWHIGNVLFKPYPACGLHGAGIQGIRSIVDEHGVRPEDIESIVIKADPLLQTPNRTTTEVYSFADMQFSNVNVFAAGAFYGDKPAPTWQMPVVYDDPRVKALARKIRVEVHPEAEALMAPRLKAGKMAVFWNTIVEVTAGGKRFVTEVTAPKGAPENPMTESEIIEKFRSNFAFSLLDSSRCERIVATVGDLENLEDFSDLAALLSLESER